MKQRKWSLDQIDHTPSYSDGGSQRIEPAEKGEAKVCDGRENFSRTPAHSLEGRHAHCLIIPAYASAGDNTVCTIPQRGKIENGDGVRRELLREAR